MHKEAKKWNYILLLGLICLNFAVILHPISFFFQDSIQTKNTFTIGPINHQNKDPSIPISPPYPHDSSSLLPSIDNQSLTIYGFSIITPNDRTCFNTLPNLLFYIKNATFITEHFYQVRIYNQSVKQNADLLWFSCNPINFESQQLILTNFQNIWENTLPETAIYLDFKINAEVLLYTVLLYKDFTPPQFTFSVRMNTLESYISYNGSIKYYRTSPLIKLEITENMPHIMFAHQLINNRLYSYEIFNFTDIYANFELFFPYWDNLPEGLNQIMLYMEDNAGNISPFQFFAFIKDTTSPLSMKQMEDLSCIRVGNRAIKEFRNPIYQTYEISEDPIFYFSLSTDDVSCVILKVDIANIPIDKEEMNNSYPHFAKMEQKMIGIQALNSYPSNIDKDFLEFQAEQVDPTLWKIEIPEWLWAKIGGQKVQMVIIVEDLAGNQATITLTIMRSDETGAILSRIMVLFFTIFIGVIITLGIFITVLVIRRPSKNQPLEKQLAHVDGDLLDLAIPCANKTVLCQFSEFVNQFNKKIDLDCITPPTLRNFLTASLQCINPAEIHFLLTQFKMEPSEQEEFLHEMLSMNPEERAEFIIKFMEESSCRFSEEDEDSFISDKNEDFVELHE